MSIFEGGTPADWGKAAWNKYVKNNFSGWPSKGVTGDSPGFLEDWIGFWKVWVIGE